MLCENCKKNEANTTLTRNINGHVTVQHLCAECAAKKGLGTMGSVFGSMLGGIFSDFVGTNPAAKCKVCGSTFADFTRTGKAGCPNCYEEFYPQLLPTLQKIHGKTGHVGKAGTVRENAAKTDEPSETEKKADEKPSSARVPTKEDKIEDLKARLAKAVVAQEYEQAAALRDEIKALEKNESV
ncbi:MAG TPA: UvrB/UvrC motif-containing protein [Oscillospiraceae bacterium]|nr:UvrB/UvrC motif-containing protein [Oscillospiraceae bacterium]HPS33735.1 UvrB/UvrC motif-containing protein [Oscillospiraceae bacterium]